MQLNLSVKRNENLGRAIIKKKKSFFFAKKKITFPHPASPQTTTGIFARTLKSIRAIFIKLSPDKAYSGSSNFFIDLHAKYSNLIKRAFADIEL